MFVDFLYYFRQRRKGFDFDDESMFFVDYVVHYHGRIAKIFASFRKSGSRNTMVRSDFRPEVEIRPFRACAMHTAIIIGTVRALWTWPFHRKQLQRERSFTVV